MDTTNCPNCKARQAKIDLYVSFGYSRDFAEGFVPMTVAEIRRHGMAARGYQSEMTGFVNRKRGK